MKNTIQRLIYGFVTCFVLASYCPTAINADTKANGFTSVLPSSSLSNGLCTVFVADNDSNDLLITCSSDGINWSGNIRVGTERSKTAPAVTLFNNQLCVIFVADNPSNHLLITCSSDANNWPGNTLVGEQNSKATPSVSVFQDKICIAYVADVASNDLYVTCSSDGVNWPSKVQVGGERSKTAPALTVFENKLCVAFVADNPSNDLLLTCSADGINWPGNTQVRGERSKTAPAVAIFNDDLCVVFVADNPSNELLTVCSSDGTNWQGNTLIRSQRSKTAPAAAVFNYSLCVTFVADNSSNDLLVTCMSGDWPGNIPIRGERSKTAPALIAFNNELHTTYVADNESNEMLGTFSAIGEDWSSDTKTGGERSKTAPSATIFNDKLCVVFVADNETNHLLITCSSDGVNWSPNNLVGGERSKTAPSAIVFNDKLCVVFVADNETNHLLITCSSDGVSWAGNSLIGGERSKTAPSTTVFNNNLCVTFVADNETNHLLITCSSDGVNWPGNSLIGGERSKTAPTVTVFDHRLCVVFVADNETNHLLITCSSDGVNWPGNRLIGGERSKTAPSTRVFNKKLCVVFVADNPSNHLLITCSLDGVNWPGNTLMGGQRSKTAATVVVFDMPSIASKDINVSISLHRLVPDADRAAYEEILQFFADAIYEMSNGANRVNDVVIYQNANTSGVPKVDVIWNANEWPRANVSGVSSSGGRVIMGDVWPDPTTPYNALDPANRRCSGYGLAHEFGHYYYGLYDEYQASNTDHDHEIDFPHSDDTGVQNSVMNSQWNACGASPNLNWLNFSIARHNTQRNAQHRMYEASGWQTLARLPSEDPRASSVTARTSRPYYLELSEVAPQGNQDAPIELPSLETEARVRLDIQWVDLGSGGQAIYSSLTQQETAFPAYIDSVSGDVVDFPQPVILVARVGKTNPIAKAEVQTSIQSPSGQTLSLALQDNGLAPDVRANDGLYSGLMPYNQGGVYTATVIFSNNSGNAVFTADSFSCQHVIGPNGETCVLTTKPVGQNFSSKAEIDITVSNYQPDDHGNSPQVATLLADNNVDVAGGISVGSDIDVFKVLPSSTGRLSIRVTDLAFGMQPKIRILQADGTTVSDEFEFAPMSEGYFVTTIDVQIYQPFYVSIAHQDVGASTGLYKISVGKPLAGEDMAVYLPLISR